MTKSELESIIVAGSDLEAERKLNEQMLAKLQGFLRQYAPAGDKNERDTVQGRFHIDFSTPLPQFDGHNCIAYAATDAMEPSLQIFAHVCDPAKTQRYRAIQLLQTVDHRAVLPLKGSGCVVQSSDEEERFAIVYGRPLGHRLSELVAQNKISMNPHSLCEIILAPIVSALEQFGEMDISHGLINPDNIFIDEKAVLGPFVSEPCGFSQPFVFESVERIQAMPSAKGDGSISHDFYALAVTMLYVLHGPSHFAGFTKESLIMSILREGAYNTLMRDKEVPEIFYDFFRGTLTQNPDDRWSIRQLKTWLEGKRYNVLPPPPPIDAIRPFEYQEIYATTRRELAHVFASNWDQMITSLQSNQLAHWVSVSLRNKELADAIGRMSRTVIELAGKNETQISELLMNIVLLLDPQGPIRIRHMAMHVDGIDTMCADLYTAKANHELQFLAKFIETSMVNYWLTLQTKRNLEYKVPERINALILKLERHRTIIRNSGFGFGLERMLYDLNPDMPCLSPLFANKHITSLPMLLKQLDKMTPTLMSEDIIDRHISAFIASKLSIQHEIRLHDLASVPALASDRNFLALYLLALVQDRLEGVRLPGLTTWLIIRIMPLMDSIHSRTLKSKIKSLLMTLAPMGYLSKVAELVITADYAETDSNGFQQAFYTYHENAAEIASLQTPERQELESQRMGLNMATMLAYAGFLLSVFIIMRGIM